MGLNIHFNTVYFFFEIVIFGSILPNYNLFLSLNTFTKEWKMTNRGLVD